MVVCVVSRMANWGEGGSGGEASSGLEVKDIEEELFSSADTHRASTTDLAPRDLLPFNINLARSLLEEAAEVLRGIGRMKKSTEYS